MVMTARKKTFSEILESTEQMSDRELQQLIIKATKQKKQTGSYEKQMFRINNINLEDHLKEAGMGHSCPKCGSTLIVSNGRRENGVQRLMCSDCHHSFTYFTGTILEKTKYSWNAWIEIVYLMLHNASVQMIKENLESEYLLSSITKQTILNWQNKIIEACKELDAPVLSGIVECDETGFREAQKGSKELKDPLHPKEKRAPRVRKETSQLGSLGPEWNNVLCAVDHNGHVIAKHIGVGAAKAIDFDTHIAPHLSGVSYLCSDANGIYDKWCKKNNILHYVRPSYYPARLAECKGNKDMIEKYYNDQMLDYILEYGSFTMGYKQFCQIKKENELSLAHVNEFHSLLKNDIRTGKRNVSSKNLDGWIAWECMRVNWRADHETLPSTRKDAEKIFTMILQTKRNILIKDIRKRKADFSHLSAQYVSNLEKKTEQARKKKQNYKYYLTSEAFNENFNTREFLQKLPVSQLKLLARKCGMKKFYGAKKGKTWQLMKEIEKQPDLKDAIDSLIADWGMTKDEDSQ